ncbi:hypothetical protein AX774_g7566 [Zancudomyces culisetae]|uniref:Uncharacterized protein n=1 Tax=Zancudomyces culisetae TaxID=1213189 RepID=A0A1R1PDH5_ZANCU|nr:hypothetical protein AX774_g7566 [Zancudomyces culisetae]|eukprot:OMH79027.1 hypothetical protein AX774_g7566 [Zancudomyces culisetae]
MNHSHTLNTTIEDESTLDRKATDELTLSDVESQYLNSKAFGCPEEMVYWLNLYARWLATNSSAEQILALCSELLVPPNTKGLLASSSYSTVTSPTNSNSTNSPPTCKENSTGTLPISSGSMNTTSQQSGLSQSGLHSWACSLLGIPKRELLAQILPILASERGSQTIVENY